MTDFLIYLIEGALIGQVYALIAMGFVVIYRASKVFNFAQGELVVLGGYLVWWMVLGSGLPAWVGIPLAFALAALTGIVIERIFFSRLVGESLFSMVMVTVGLLVLLRGVFLVIWGAHVRPFPMIVPMRPLILGELFISRSLLIGGAVTVVAAVGLSWFFNRTTAGLRMTAVAEDHQIAMSLGISVKRSVAFAWMLGAVLSTVGAIVFLNGKSLSFLASDIGFAALPVAMLAGLESIGGLILAGLVVGIAQGMAAAYLDPLLGGGVSTVLPFVVMILILFFRPNGLFGWKLIERV
ncbi:MAG: branched-chain amino acid ABC transporter permease [Candidatus Lambdaproteobacteria bacterium]|nr:branched-chain amino acid ABC transporter permease [Candidatus Lambdaproteobacteria bacterium]